MKNKKTNKPLRVLVVCHGDLIPGVRKTLNRRGLVAPWKTESDVCKGLKSLGHHVDIVGILDSFKPLVTRLNAQKYDVVFNLLEEFAGNSSFENILPELLKDLDVPFTGCDADALIACRRKTVTKYILRHCGVLTPRFVALDAGVSATGVLEKFTFPAIVKLSDEDASLGISKSSLVWNPSQAKVVAESLFARYGGRVLVERFIAGREFHVTVFKKGKKTLVFEPLETVFTRSRDFSDTIATEKIKWNSSYRSRSGVVNRRLEAKEKLLHKKLKSAAQKVCEALSIDAYARVDFRVDRDGRAYVIDVNPNPDVAKGHEVAETLKVSHVDYSQMLEFILRQGLTRARDRQKNLRKSRPLF